eukprot:TRINITY_DN1360_c0_g1_i2.p1 TRINITY_DN1360_c0_g1~~TRINITY_DN1360_c0_g1_i2.p1  ORF type:complete len:226 (-),score=44.01 TRINITY_DN1360_c0_g1_i2:143-745(-)
MQKVILQVCFVLMQLTNGQQQEAALAADDECTAGTDCALSALQRLGKVQIDNLQEEEEAEEQVWLSPAPPEEPEVIQDISEIQAERSSDAPTTTAAPTLGPGLVKCMCKLNVPPKPGYANLFCAYGFQGFTEHKEYLDRHPPQLAAPGCDNDCAWKCGKYNARFYACAGNHMQMWLKRYGTPDKDGVNQDCPNDPAGSGR